MSGSPKSSLFKSTGFGFFERTWAALSGVSVNVSFGTLCLLGFFRVLPPVLTSGASNSCTGAFDYDFGANFATLQGIDPLLQIGNDINVQGWYRDPPNPASANFTNAMFYTMT